MRWGRWWSVWFPGVQGWDDTWFLKSTPSSIPAGENQLHFDLLVMEAGEGGHAEKFIPGLSLGEQAHLLPAQKTCLWWIALTSDLVWKSHPGSSELSVFSGAGLLTSSWQCDGPGIHLCHRCEPPASRVIEFWGLVGTPAGNAEKAWREFLSLCYLDHELSLKSAVKSSYCYFKSVKLKLK